MDIPPSSTHAIHFAHEHPVSQDLRPGANAAEILVVASAAVGICLARAGARGMDLAALAPVIVEAVECSDTQPWFVVAVPDNFGDDRDTLVRIDTDERGVRVQAYRCLRGDGDGANGSQLRRDTADTFVTSDPAAGRGRTR